MPAWTGQSQGVCHAGITRERLESFDRAIRAEPEDYPEKRGALIADFRSYLGILKARATFLDLQILHVLSPSDCSPSALGPCTSECRASPPHQQGMRMPQSGLGVTGPRAGLMFVANHPACTAQGARASPAPACVPRQDDCCFWGAGGALGRGPAGERQGGFRAAARRGQGLPGLRAGPRAGPHPPATHGERGGGAHRAARGHDRQQARTHATSCLPGIHLVPRRAVPPQNVNPKDSVRMQLCVRLEGNCQGVPRRTLSGHNARVCGTSGKELAPMLQARMWAVQDCRQ